VQMGRHTIAGLHAQDDANSTRRGEASRVESAVSVLFVFLEL
jgi:hypothetical protein